MMDPRSKYSPKQKAEAVAAMVLWGDSITASKKCGVKACTIRWWKTQSVWWPGVEARFKREKNEELDAGYTRAIHSLQEHMEKIIKDGEPVYSPKTGEIVSYRKPSFKDSYMGMAIMQDKRSLIRGEPTTISSKSSSEHLKEIYDNLMALSEDMKKKKKDPKIVSEQ